MVTPEAAAQLASFLRLQAKQLCAQLKQIRDDVEGKPLLMPPTARRLDTEAQEVRRVAAQVDAVRTRLAKTWRGPDSRVFAATATRLSVRLNDVHRRLGNEKAWLTTCQLRLVAARAAVALVIARFEQNADRMIAEVAGGRFDPHETFKSWRANFQTALSEAQRIASELSEFLAERQSTPGPASQYMVPLPVLDPSAGRDPNTLLGVLSDYVTSNRVPGDDGTGVLMCVNGNCDRALPNEDFNATLPPGIQDFERRLVEMSEGPGTTLADLQKNPDYHASMNQTTVTGDLSRLEHELGRAPAPRMDTPLPDRPVATGDRTLDVGRRLPFGPDWLPAPLIPLWGGPVQHVVDPATGAVANVTMPGHTFHPGYIIKWLDPQLDGTVNSMTLGRGSGDWGTINRVMGPRLFHWHDTEIAQRARSED
jgi:uncharacterized protein YukE